MVSAKSGTMVSGDSFIYCRFKLPILSGFNIKMQISSVLVFFPKRKTVGIFFPRRKTVGILSDSCFTFL